MTAEARDEGATQAAAGWFVVGAYLMLGGVGIVIAAMAVGFESVLTSRTRPKGEGWTQTLADQRAWLAQDAVSRRRWRDARRAWWESGADPASRPVRPSGPSRFGAWLRRTIARLVLAADATVRAGGRFAAGFRRGWTAAKTARENGASFGEIIRAGRAGTPTDPTDAPTDPDPQPDPTAAAPEQPAAAPARKPSPRPQPDPATAVPTPSTEPEPEPNTKENTVTATLGETNLDTSAAMIADIQGELSGIDELTDQLAARRQSLAGMVMRAQEHATANGAPAGTAQALDEARAVVDLLGQHLGAFSDATAHATDTTSAADAGLRPARDAQDTLHSAGATGEFVSAATSD